MEAKKSEKLELTLKLGYPPSTIYLPSYKFRTMVADTAQRGPGITRDADPRITRARRFLRKLKIDEMP